MKNLEINIQDECAKIHHQYGMSEMANYRIEQLFDKKLKEKLRWIPVDEKEPESFKNDEDGIYYSKYLELKVNGYDYPLIGYYVNANDDQFYDIISEKDDEIKQEDVTHYRFVVEA
jgi:hypothetical protein